MSKDAVRHEFQALLGILRSAALEASSADEALRFLRIYAHINWTNISGLFDDAALEEAIYQKWFARYQVPDSSGAETVSFLHVASRLYTFGGHTRLMKELIGGMGTDGPHKIVLSNQKRLDKRIKMPADCSLLKGSPTARLKALLKHAAQAKTILLYIHPDDSVAALAARIMQASGKRVLFVNHADHVFCLGTSAADVVLEVCMTGWRTTKDRRAARSQSFMGIPFPRMEKGELPQQTLRTGPIVSMGGAIKFEPAGTLDFPSFVERVLQKTDRSFVLIGPSAKDPWWPEVAQKFPDRVNLLGTQPSEEVTKILGSASCYIDSFPMDGGTAYSQAVMMGLPCFGPNSKEALGISPADQLRFETVSEMEDAVVAYLKTGEYPFNLNAVQQQIASDFEAEHVAGRVVAAANGILSEPMDYLKEAGKRDSDYNARRWEQKGTIDLPKREWRGIGFRARARLLRQIQESALPDTTKGILRRRIRRRLI